MLEEKDYIELRFGYTNTWGDTTDAQKKVILITDIQSEFETIVYEFKEFLLDCGFAPSMVDQIEIAI